ncbi:hypothetical protein TNCV_3604091 [Trichonephila clavipes]|nr:hypothetical protein TNCV_3604091 [Trichonephila clavipes]
MATNLRPPQQLGYGVYRNPTIAKCYETVCTGTSATRKAFGNGPRIFEQRSSDEDDTGAGTPSPNLPTTPTRGRLSLDLLNVHRPL